MSQKRYTYTVRSVDGESLQGYMHRLSVRNFHSHTRWIKRDVGMPAGKLSLTTAHLRQLALISGRDVCELTTMQSPPPKDNRTTFAGWQVSETEIERNRARICPDCFLAQRVHLRMWTLRIITVCPIHCAKLIDECPTCKDPLTWSRLDLSKCDNGHLLKRGATESLVAVKELTAVRAIYEKCGVPLEGSRELERLPEAIRDLDLSEFIALLLLVGRAAVRDRTAWRSNGAYRYDPDKTHRILAAGFEIATKWPGSFMGLLGELHTRSKRKKHHIGLGPDVARMFRMFANRDSLPFLEKVKSAIREYVEQHQVFLHDRTKRMLGYRAKEMDFISTVEAGKILERSKETARKLAIANGWCDGAPGAGNILRIERRKVEEWRDNESTMTVTAAGRALGLWPAAAFDLVDQGLLPCVHTGRYPGRHLVRKSTVDGLLRVIERKPTGRGAHDDAQILTSWRWFQTRAGSNGLRVGAALQAMVDGRLKAHAREDSRKGFGGLLFKLLDLHRLAACSNRAGGAGLGRLDNAMVSMSDAARVSGIANVSIARAVDLRILRAGEARGGRGARLIKMSDLEVFMKRYATVGRLAKDHGVHANAVRSVLSYLKIEPVGGRRGRYSAYPLYLISDIKRRRFPRVLQSQRRESR